MVGALGRRRTGRVGAVPGQVIAPRRLLSRIELADGTVRSDELRAHRRGTHEPVVQRLLVTHAVGVRRQVGRRRRYVDTRVADHERLAHRPLSLRIRRPVQHVSVERHGGRAAGVERKARHAAVPNQGLREVPVGDPDAPATLASVDGEHDDRAIGPLADRRARIASMELGPRQRLPGVEDRTAVLHQGGPGAHGVGDGRPVVGERDPDRERRSDDCLVVQRSCGGSARDEDRTVRGYVDAGIREDGLHDTAEIAARSGRWERSENDHRSVRRRRLRSPDRREQRRRVGTCRLVQLRDALPGGVGPVPPSVPRDAIDVKIATRVDADRGASEGRLMLDDAAAHQEAARPAAGPAEEIAVDADRRHLRRGVALHRRDGFPSDDRPVRQQRRQAVQTTRLRSRDHVDGDRSRRSPPQDPVVGDARHHLNRTCGRRWCDHEREQEGDQ